jgi:endonuclease/exonuclease/phosphatase family metal-dependent hydrolase
VRGSWHDDGDNLWGKRAALNIKTLLKYAPDVIGFQEAQSGNLESYVAPLAHYHSELGPISIRKTESYERVPIFWKAQQFRLMDSGGFYLSQTPDTWSPGWGARLVRAATWVRLRCAESRVEFIHLNTHFDHEQDSVRELSAALIIDLLPEIARDLPVVISADFNALPGSDTYQHFIDAGYSDSYLAAGHDDGDIVNTFHDFEGADFARRRQGVRIDWILVHPRGGSITVEGCEVITDATPPVYPSDHYPVMARLQIG